MLMATKAIKFVKNRKQVVAITSNRINNILWYVIECYLMLLKDNPSYSKKAIRQNTSLHFEDYLKMELVDNYLVPHKHLILAKASELEKINFHYETQKRYVDTIDRKEKPDKIDIYINHLGLQNYWNQQDENLYFVLECKRIKILSDCTNYVLDIQNFANRNYRNLRLPFEGQIGFIENPKLNPTSVSSEINKILKATSTIITQQFLLNTKLHSSYKGCYSSIHKKNYDKRINFNVLHLLLNYSSLVKN